MAEADLDTASTGPCALALDPFAHLPGVSSRIPGLGGTAPGHDPTYVFHTQYIEVAPGPATFTVSLEGLRAKQGTLVLRVHLLPIEDGAHAVLANSERVQLNRLVALGGVASIRFESFRGVRFALYGSIPGNSDIEATGLTVTLDRPAHFADVPELELDGRTSSYGRDRAKPAHHLISTETAILRRPVCQICTSRQLQEPIFQEWISELGIDGEPPAEQWSSAYVMQALAQYGMLTEGARGLGLGSEFGSLPAAMAKRGASVLAVRHGNQDDAAMAPVDEQAEGATSISAHAQFRTADIGDLPRDIVNFDFAWSCGWAARRGSIAAGIMWIDQTIARLRPGGLAVYTLPYIPVAAATNTVDLGMSPFRRRDLERLALILISRGHEVAQIKIDGDRDPVADRHGGDALGRSVTACGLIVRKAANVL